MNQYECDTDYYGEIVAATSGERETEEDSTPAIQLTMSVAGMPHIDYTMWLRPDKIERVIETLTYLGFTDPNDGWRNPERMVGKKVGFRTRREPNDKGYVGVAYIKTKGGGLSQRTPAADRKVASLFGAKSIAPTSQRGWVASDDDVPFGN